jgi:hypothetical protein
MKILISLLLLIPSLSWSKINISERDLCLDKNNKSTCDALVGKFLFGFNKIVNFSFLKGQIVTLISVNKGENISLLEEPDPSFVASYEGIYFVIESNGEKFISKSLEKDPFELFICDTSSEKNCISTIDIQ